MKHSTNKLNCHHLLILVLFQNHMALIFLEHKSKCCGECVALFISNLTLHTPSFENKNKTKKDIFFRVLGKYLLYSL